MKLLLLTIISSTLSLGAFAQAVPNGGMENWETEMWVLQQPTSWGTMNALGLTNGGNFPVKKVTDAHSGSFSAKIETVVAEYEGTEVTLPGLMQLGHIDVLEQQFTNGQPFTSRPDSVIFWYKYIPQGDDQGTVTGGLSYYDEANDQNQIVAAFTFFFMEEQATWKRQAVALQYLSEETPDSLFMIFTSSAAQGVEGTALWVDDISTFTNAELSVAEETAEIFSVYPNPAAETINVVTKKETIIEVCNVLGERIQVISSDISGTTSVNISDMPNGVYLLKTIGGGTKRFVVKH